MFRSVARLGQRSREHRRPHRGATSGLACLVLLVALAAGACGATSTGSPAVATTPAGATSSPAQSGPASTPAGSAAGSPAPSATARCCPPAATPTTFWVAATRGLAAAAHLQVTSTGPNPGIFRFEPKASATIVAGRVAFVCLRGAAFDGQSGFTRVPGTWTCGTPALVSGFRSIGQPADSWNRTSPTDSSIAERVAVGADGMWTWTYTGVSPFLGGRVSTTVRLDPASGRLLAARRTDSSGVTTYTFDYTTTFPALAVPKP